MSTMQSTVARVAQEEAEKRAAEPTQPRAIDSPEAAALSGDGWVPGDVPQPDVSEHAEVNPLSLGAPEEDVSRETSGPLPSLGHIVVYHLRTGDSRNRRVKFPAIVMDTDPDTRRLKLWVIVDDGDTWMQDNVPARAEPEPGWEPVAEDQEYKFGRVKDMVQRLLVERVAVLERDLEAKFAALADRVVALEQNPMVTFKPKSKTSAKQKG